MSILSNSGISFSCYTKNMSTVEVEVKKKYPQVAEAKKAYRPKPGEVIIGIDEVGRGCWAGPLVVGAVAIQQGILGGVIDSKRMTREKRAELAPQIKKLALGWGLGVVSAETIDRVGLQEATSIGIKEAMKQCLIPYDTIVIDGWVNFLPDNKKATARIAADNYLYSVSAASIVAKDARDNYMVELAKNYPDYGFESHVGYGTPSHIKSIEEHGVVPGLHRINNVERVRMIYEQAMVSTEAEKAAIIATEAARLQTETSAA
jgi:ribonuclease HII